MVDDVPTEQRRRSSQLRFRCRDTEADIVAIYLHARIREQQRRRYDKIVADPANSRTFDPVCQERMIDLQPCGVELHQHGRIRTGIDEKRNRRIDAQRGDRDMSLDVWASRCIAEAAAEHQSTSVFSSRSMR